MEGGREVSEEERGGREGVMEGGREVSEEEGGSDGGREGSEEGGRDGGRERRDSHGIKHSHEGSKSKSYNENRFHLDHVQVSTVIPQLLLLFIQLLLACDCLGVPQLFLLALDCIPLHTHHPPHPPPLQTPHFSCSACPQLLSTSCNHLSGTPGHTKYLAEKRRGSNKII